MKQLHRLRCKALTFGPKHHFFGYCGICPWDKNGRYVLCVESDFSDRLPTAEDCLTIGFVDTHRGDVFTKVAETRAWNFQQACFLRWNPAFPDREIFFNDRQDGQFVAVALDITNGQKRLLSRALYDVSYDGLQGLSLNFSRLNDAQQGCGYVGLPDPFETEPYPDSDGIYFVDLTSQKMTLIISYAQVAEQFLREDLNGQKLWFNRLLFNTDASRFVFLAMYESPLKTHEVRWLTSMFTANPDGSDIFCLSKQIEISHFDWYDRERLLVWTARPKYGKNYYLLTDKTEYYEIIGRNILTQEGHCNYSPDRKWIAIDTYPDSKNMRSIILFDLKKEVAIEVGKFSDRSCVWGNKWEIRCDLHTRWSRDGKKICFDSAMTDTRQMYVLDVSSVA